MKSVWPGRYTVDLHTYCRLHTHLHICTEHLCHLSKAANNVVRFENMQLKRWIWVLCIEDRAEWRGTAAAQLLRACEERAVGHNWASWRTEHLQLHQILLVSGAISRQGDISYLHSRLPICLKQRAADTWGADLPTAGCLCHVMLTADFTSWVSREDRGKRDGL